jgi:hypothetical protein
MESFLVVGIQGSLEGGGGLALLSAEIEASVTMLAWLVSSFNP